MREKHCNSCTCGLTYVEWSDRGAHIDLTDQEAIADIVINCALDHEYDRTGDGIPYGIPDEIREKLAPIVAQHLSAIEPNWENVTVSMWDKKGAREAFHAALIKAQK